MDSAGLTKSSGHITAQALTAIRPTLTSEWTYLDLWELIQKTKDLTLVAWIGKVFSMNDLLSKCNELEVQARQLDVGTRGTWQQIVEKDCYVVRYHDDAGNEVNFDNQKATHFTVRDFGARYGNDPEYQKKTGNILISAFDTVKNKRVIVDGIHRAAVMSGKYSRDSDFTNRIVYEWYGHNVKEIFPYDFNQFYRTRTAGVK